MSNFTEFCNDTYIFESAILSVEKEEYEELNQVLDESLEVLEELFGLEKLGKKLVGASQKADEKVEKGKEVLKKVGVAAGETAKKAGTVVSGMAGDLTKDIRGATKSNVDAAKAGVKKVGETVGTLKDKFTKISSGSREAFKKMFKNLGELNDAQKETYQKLEPLYTKMSEGKTISGSDGLVVLASILAAGPDGSIPKIKDFNKQLEKLRTTPMFSSFKVSVKKL